MGVLFYVAAIIAVWLFCKLRALKAEMGAKLSEHAEVAYRAISDATRDLTKRLEEKDAELEAETVRKYHHVMRVRELEERVAELETEVAWEQELMDRFEGAHEKLKQSHEAAEERVDEISQEFQLTWGFGPAIKTRAEIEREERLQSEDDYRKVLELKERLEHILDRIEEVKDRRCSLTGDLTPLDEVIFRDLYRQRNSIFQQMAQIEIPYYEGGE